MCGEEGSLPIPSATTLTAKGKDRSALVPPPLFAPEAKIPKLSSSGEATVANPMGVAAASQKTKALGRSPEAIERRKQAWKDKKKAKRAAAAASSSSSTSDQPAVDVDPPKSCSSPKAVATKQEAQTWEEQVELVELNTGQFDDILLALSNGGLAMPMDICEDAKADAQA